MKQGLFFLDQTILIFNANIIHVEFFTKRTQGFCFFVENSSQSLTFHDGDKIASCTACSADRKLLLFPVGFGKEAFLFPN